MRRLTLVAVALCLPVPACGGSDDDREQPDTRPIRSRVTSLYAAAAAQDGRALCRQLARGWRERLDRRAPRCASESLTVVLGPGPPRNVRIGRIDLAGDRATARASAVRGHGAAERTYRHVLELEREAGRWVVVRSAPSSSG
jgi:hypothetical protein